MWAFSLPAAGRETISAGAAGRAQLDGCGLLLAALIWQLNVERRTKLLIAPLLGLACIAS